MALTLEKAPDYSFLELEPSALRSEPRWFDLLWVGNRQGVCRTCSECELLASGGGVGLASPVTSD